MTKKRDDSKDAIIWLFLIGLFAIGFAYYSHDLSKDKQIEDHIEQMNVMCDQLEKDVMNIYTGHGWYEL